MQEKLRKLEQKISEYGLSVVQDQIMALVRPAIALIPEAADEDNIPLGATKLWGMPHVPPTFAWPKSDGMVFGFLGQINLEDVRTTYDLGLPSNGLLSFWFHEGINGSYGHGKAFYFPSSELTVLELPEEDESDDLSFVFDFIETTWRARLIAFPSLPYAYHYDSIYLPLLNFSEDEIDAYRDLQSEMSDFFDLPRDDYQIGGYPHRGQQDPHRLIYFAAHHLSESDFDEGNAEATEKMLNFARNLRLLAQFDGHNLDIEDSSEGSIYFLHDEQMLSQHSFENPYTLLNLDS